MDAGEILDSAIRANYRFLSWTALIALLTGIALVVSLFALTAGLSKPFDGFPF
jgi:hypothetical protein